MTAKKEIKEIEVKSYSFIVPQKDINIPTPIEVLKVRKGRGGKKFVYVETNYVIRKLNDIFSYGWDFEIIWEIPVELALQLGQVMVKGRLTVKGKDSNGNIQTVSKTQYGSAEIKYVKDKPHTPENIVDLADDYKAAASDALKKCASMFGICLDVYSGQFSPEDLPVEENKGEDVVIEGEYKEEKEIDLGKLTYELSAKQRRWLYSLASQLLGTEDLKKGAELIHSSLIYLFGKEAVKEEPDETGKETHKITLPNRDFFDELINNLKLFKSVGEFNEFIEKTKEKILTSRKS